MGTYVTVIMSNGRKARFEPRQIVHLSNGTTAQARDLKASDDLALCCAIQACASRVPTHEQGKLATRWEEWA